MTVLNEKQLLKNGKYRIERPLSPGRFTVSYVARRSDGERWVIKVLNPQLLASLSPEERNRQETLFWQEAVKLSKCSGNPHIAKVGMPFKEGEFICLPTEYLDGNSLAERSERKLLESTALDYIRQIGEALTLVHAQGLVHRDIRPGNIYLRIRQGKVEAVLTNFGLAVNTDTELSRTRRHELTDGFSPIELYSGFQKSGNLIGARTDVYSLAATLYELLTGETPCSVEDRKLNGQPLASPQSKNSAISGKTNDAILQGMNILPEKRPRSVQQWLSKLKVKNENKERRPKQEKSVDWGKWQTIVAIIAIVASLIVSIPSFISSRPSGNKEHNSPSSVRDTAP